MSQLQTLIDQRATAWDKMQGYNDEAETAGWSGELEASYDAAEAEYDKLDGQVARAEKHAERAAANSKVDRTGVVRPADDISDEAEESARVYSEAFQLFVRNGMADLSGDQRTALRAGFTELSGKEIRAAGGVGTGAGGGYLVPTGFRETIIEKQKAYGAVQAVATVIDTESGNPLPWATNDDTGNVGALLAENTAASEQDFTFGTAQLGAYKYTSKLGRESIEFLQDVPWMNVEQFLGRKLGERLGRIHNQHFTTGTGSSQPQGIVTGATSGVTAAAVAAITADELIDLQHSVDPAYRNERAKFMLSDTALKGLRKLKYSGSGEYIFQPGVAAGVPSMLAGAGYVINQDMAVPATAVKSVLFGDFEAGYVIRRVMNLELLRLAERYAEYGQVGFIAFDRMDGLVQDANAYKALTQA